MTADPRRALPAVDRLVTEAMVSTHGAARATAAAREVLARARAAASDGVPELDELRRRVTRRLSLRVRRTINATGVVLHTNLGRAPWSEGAVAAAKSAAGYAAVELELPSGRRGRRGAGVEDRLRALTGAEAAHVVNNNAAAVVVVLAELARGRSVLVSRGQLVEIGGGFRVPEIMEASGARLVEVGTTNRTHLRDYEAALDDDVAAVLWVHHSNFRQVGFIAQPDPGELTALGRPVVVDLGSGALAEIGDEPTVAGSLGAGADLVCFSGDKLLGGPQAGVILGRAELVDRVRRHPLSRALRPGKVTLAALEATLDDWLTGRAVPVRAMIDADTAALRAEVERWRAALPEGVDATVADVEGAVGGGSVPGRTWPSVALSIRAPDPEPLRRRLLAGDPPVVPRVHRGALLLDARTVVPLGQGEDLLAALLAAL